jgi:three-Cys-motif partner protein
MEACILSKVHVRVREDVVGSWALQKHELLRKYLGAYTTIMKCQPWCRGYDYIDGFAGSGTARLRDRDVPIDGSPRIALSLPHPFTTYTFIETEPWRVEELQRLRSEFPNRDIRIVEGDCNHVITREIAPRFHYQPQRRGFILLDPFSTQVEYDTIQQIAETSRIEIFLHFPTMAMNRAVLHNELNDDADGSLGYVMDRLWGNHEWYDLLYVTQPDLFGNPRNRKIRRTSAEFLSRLFVEHRLKRLFEYVIDPIVIKNTHGAGIYALIFAGHNKSGAKIANDVFRKKHEPLIHLPEPATLSLELPF